MRIHTRARLSLDLAAMEQFRPGYSFWRHIFSIPDGSIIFGSALDGRLLVTFPTQGDWMRDGSWEDSSLAPLMTGQRLPSRITQRRERLAELLAAPVGPVLHNPTRGNFLLPNVRRYGSFLDEWGAIFERFGVPAEIGLAQAMVESGLNGNVRSEAGAIGFCQWLPGNWKRLRELSPNVIEAPNQTTQAAYCAVYLSVLATKYGSFIPALSEHHAGVTNVGRTVVNGQRLGGDGARDQYFLGSEFARDLRTMSPRTFRDIVGTYGPRSFLYTEMVFGNAQNAADLRATIPQEEIFAIRVQRTISIDEIRRRTGLSANELRRFNPALVRQVPASANLYLPSPVEELGRDVSFWHHAAPPEFAAVLNDFVRLEALPHEWDHPSFEAVLRSFQQRFLETDTEGGRRHGGRARLPVAGDEDQSPGDGRLPREPLGPAGLQGRDREAGGLARRGPQRALTTLLGVPPSS